MKDRHDPKVWRLLKGEIASVSEGPEDATTPVEGRVDGNDADVVVVHHLGHRIVLPEGERSRLGEPDLDDECAVFLREDEAAYDRAVRPAEAHVALWPGTRVPEELEDYPEALQEVEERGDDFAPHAQRVHGCLLLLIHMNNTTHIYLLSINM
jgi:hypothetical protein